ncbi:uncharacterized protein ACA1_275490 [Acanthamoeba castellanii str. Neff]|uniref:Uncharacterized protein n=1 Tax=Acanthamoeba castellanii (strain ATCC 30010 / Neff) TaxID=1257118 RepID=L8GQV7_ACACF|nr:uncharacterized protein ACA1_275490 [Acanthamoeba castellanii str. Neff]ELR15375.1 hypothetical protein ACA1_275490 [Acanthamoeba castellanii str. Neff]
MEWTTPIAGPELVLFYGPPQSGKTRYFEKQLKSTHIRVSAEDTFRAQPHMSLHRVVNMAMSHLQAGKSVVIGMLAQTPSHDTNSKRATRASYIRALRSRLAMCRVVCINFKPLGDVLQCQWQNEWARAASLAAKEAAQKSSLASDRAPTAIEEGHVGEAANIGVVESEAWDNWMADADPPDASEGFDEIKLVECSLRSYSSTPFDTKGLMIDAEALYEFNAELLSDAFFGGTLPGGDWVKLRDDVEQVLCEFQDNFAKARFIVVMNEASILPAEVHLLDPTQSEVQFSRFRTRLMDELAKLSVTTYYLYLPRRSSIHSAFLKPPSPGFIAWLQERHRLMLSESLFVVRENSPLAAAARGYVTQIHGEHFFNSSGWLVQSKVRMHSREPTARPAFLSSIEPPVAAEENAADGLLLGGDSPAPPLCTAANQHKSSRGRSETIDDVLMHGLVLPVKVKSEFELNVHHAPATAPAIPTITAPTNELSAPVTPIPREKQRSAAANLLRTPTTPNPALDSPSGVSPRRRLPGWMSPGAPKPIKPRMPKLSEGEGEADEPKTPAKKKKTATKPKEAAAPETPKKAKPAPIRKGAAATAVKQEEPESPTEDLLLSLAKMRLTLNHFRGQEEDSEDSELLPSQPTLSSGKRKRDASSVKRELPDAGSVKPRFVMADGDGGGIDDAGGSDGDADDLLRRRRKRPHTTVATRHDDATPETDDGMGHVDLPWPSPPTSIAASATATTTTNITDSLPSWEEPAWHASSAAGTGTTTPPPSWDDLRSIAAAATTTTTTTANPTTPPWEEFVAPVERRTDTLNDDLLPQFTASRATTNASAVERTSSSSTTTTPNRHRDHQRRHHRQPHPCH